MFAALLDRLHRRDDLTADEAAWAMAAVMDGVATPVQIAGLLVALRMKGECPEEVVGFARTMRQRSVPLRERGPRPSTPVAREATGRHVQHLDRVGAGGRRCGRPRGQARQPVGLEPVRERRRPGGPRCRRRGRTASRGALPRARGHRVLLRADLPPVDAPRGRAPPRTRHSHGLQPARPAHQPRGGAPPTGRRAPAGVDRTGGARVESARGRSVPGWCTAPTASTRSPPVAIPRCRSAEKVMCAPSTCILPRSASTRH